MGYYKGTQGNWKQGLFGACVVSDEMPKRDTYNDYQFESEKTHYGGYLVAESIPTKDDARLIANSKELFEKSSSLFKHYVQIQDTGDTDFEEYEKSWEELETVLNNILNDED